QAARQQPGQLAGYPNAATAAAVAAVAALHAQQGQAPVGYQQQQQAYNLAQQQQQQQQQKPQQPPLQQQQPPQPQQQQPQQQPAAATVTGAAGQAAAAPAMLPHHPQLPPSTRFIMAVPMHWAQRLGNAAQVNDNYQYPIFQVELQREGGIKARQGPAGLSDHLYAAFTKNQYVNMVRPVGAEELTAQQGLLAAEVVFEVAMVTDYKESVTVFNLIVQEVHRSKGAALEIEVPGLQGFSLVIWPAALKTG
ncbi:hypothetical protein Agub_g8442, partial [Astrephomene gubernaculifera]